ncbi:MAG: DICT sensory domain-containing protein [Nocardioides sp.]
MSDLTIGELSAQTGVPQATLRTWESRYGFPEPQRLAGGHRRYLADDVVAVTRVLRHRSAGLNLESAIAQVVAASGTTTAYSSVFAGLRDRVPGLRTRVLGKRTLLALTRAMEDESCARATRPVLFASFQREEFYEQSRARYADLARTASDVVVFADFERHGRADRSPVRVSVPEEAPLRREWLLVCDSADHPACVTGWELPGQGAVPDAERRYESAWSVDARAVRAAARICVDLMRSFGAPSHLRLADTLDRRLSAEPAPPSADLRVASELFDRMVGYVDRG